MFIVNLVNALIGKPLGFILKFFGGLFGGNFAVAVLLFTVLINLALIPLSIKSQKSSVQQTRIKPKLDELKKKYGDDRQKMAQAQQELYQQEGVSMSGGCLPMLLRLVLMMSIYGIILSPMTYMMGCSKGEVKDLAKAYDVKTSGYYELQVIKKMDDDPAAVAQKLADWDEEYRESAADKQETTEEKAATDKKTTDKEKTPAVPNAKAVALGKKSVNRVHSVDFNLFGIDLTKTPSFSKMFSEPGADFIWLIPICAFLAQLLTGIVSARINKKTNPDAPSMMGMMLLMPLISLFIGFGLSGGVGFYWICSSLVGGAIQSGIQLFYGPFKMLSKERAKELHTRCDFEKKQLEKFAQKSE